MRISRVKGIGYTANQASPSHESPCKTSSPAEDGCHTHSVSKM